MVKSVKASRKTSDSTYMSDRTEYQSTSQIKKAQKLSLESTKPPSEIPGYSIQKLLGSGSFGEVWAGIDRKTGRRVAIKFYTRRSSLDVTLLSSEVEKLVFLAADRYVVQLLDVGWQADPPYYVMDYIENGSLEDELKKNDSFEVGPALELFDEIAVGLMHLHGKGVLHCDLKPGNVLLDTDFKPRLADFGQSRLTNEQNPSLGTLYFMAPEQADMESVPDAKWDVYALGALLYTMLTGAPPHRDDGISKSLETKTDLKDRLEFYRKSIITSPIPTAHRKVPGVDKRLAEIIDRCIAVDPKKRFSSVQSVLIALKQREASIARRPLIVLGILGPILFLLATGAFGFYMYTQAINNTTTLIVDEAKTSNDWVAQLAARSAGENIDLYMRAVVQLADDDDFKKQLSKVLEDEDLEKLRLKYSHPSSNGQFVEERKTGFIAHSERKKLEKIIVDLSSDPLYRSAASWFVCDKYGNQIAAEYLDQEIVSAETRSKNYSYRTYFTGQPRDLVNRESGTYLVDKSLEDRQHIIQPNMSAVFNSEAQNTWKVAFSAPITIDGEFAGIVAVSVSMGGFVDFQNSAGHYVMLIDSREGENTGIILEHPVIQGIKKDLKKGERISDVVSEHYLSADDLAIRDNFRDPLASVEPNGTPYRKRYLIGSGSVNRTPLACEIYEDESTTTKSTGLQVIAVEDYDLVTKPVRQLGRQLWWLLFVAIGTVATVALLLWTFLLKVMKKNKSRFGRTGVYGTESITDGAQSIPTSTASSKTEAI